MRFAVEPWAPDYGASVGELDPSGAQVEIGLERPEASWAPVRVVGVAPARTVGFVDGVRRVDAQVWVTGGDGQTRLGLCASYAAGVVRCNGAVVVERVEVRREVLCSAGDLEPIDARHVTYQPATRPGEGAEALQLALQQRMRELEIGVTARALDAELLVIDGPLRGCQDLPNAIGFVKTHRVSYLPATVADVVGRLAPGERTPLFAMTTSWSRYSWYLRLPGPNGHPWAGVVRAEVSADLAVAAARRLADLATATLPAYASAAHKDPRAPQNLYPIGGLERALRRRLGDPALLYRSLRAAAR
ncbi:MAG: DNA double-strand break repair nuclease NurA [Egibacteraceae bacterium]